MANVIPLGSSQKQARTPHNHKSDRKNQCRVFLHNEHQERTFKNQVQTVFTSFKQFNNFIDIRTI